MSGFTALPVEGMPELREGDDLAALIADAIELEDGDVLVVAQKAISKIEGRVVRLDDYEPSERAREIAVADPENETDPRRVEAILQEAKRVVRVRPPLVICETRHGFICASAGVDASNTPEAGTLVLLPLDPDASAARLRDALRARTGREVGVIVADSFGRPWRRGTTDVALGAAGVAVVREHIGERDPTGYELHATVIAIADEMAAAAQLVMGKLDRVPVAVLRGLDVAGERQSTGTRYSGRGGPLPVRAFGAGGGLCVCASPGAWSRLRAVGWRSTQIDPSAARCRAAGGGRDGRRQPRSAACDQRPGMLQHHGPRGAGNRPEHSRCTAPPPAEARPRSRRSANNEPPPGAEGGGSRGNHGFPRVPSVR